MKKVMGLLILLAVLSGIFYWIYKADEEKQAMKLALESNTLNEAKIIELIDSKNQAERDRVLQIAAKSPDQVIALNSLLIKMTYGKDLEKDQVDRLVAIQRSQFAKELLSQNNESNQKLRVWLETEKQKDQKIKVVNYKALAPYSLGDVTYDGIARKTVKVSVVYYTNISGNNHYVDYLLYEDGDKQWKIVGWAQGQEFLTSD